MSDRPVDVLSKPLAPEEEADVRERDSWCHGPRDDGSWTVYGQSAFQPMAEHTEMAFADRRRLLATLDAARSATSFLRGGRGTSRSRRAMGGVVPRPQARR